MVLLGAHCHTAKGTTNITAAARQRGARSMLRPPVSRLTSRAGLRRAQRRAGAVRKQASSGTPMVAASRGALPPSGFGTRNENSRRRRRGGPPGVRAGVVRTSGVRAVRHSSSVTTRLVHGNGNGPVAREQHADQHDDAQADGGGSDEPAPPARAVRRPGQADHGQERGRQRRAQGRQHAEEQGDGLRPRWRASRASSPKASPVRNGSWPMATGSSVDTAKYQVPRGRLPK